VAGRLRDLQIYSRDAISAIEVTRDLARMPALKPKGIDFPDGLAIPVGNLALTHLSGWLY